MTNEFDDFDLDDDLDFDLENDPMDDLDFDLLDDGEEDELDFDLGDAEDDFLAFDFSPNQELLEKPTRVELAKLVKMARKCKDLAANHPKIGEASKSPSKLLTLQEEMNHWFGMHERKPEQPIYRTQAATCAYQLLAGTQAKTVTIQGKNWSTTARVHEFKPETNIVRVVFKLPEQHLKLANVLNLEEYYTGWFNNDNGRPASDSKVPFRLN